MAASLDPVRNRIQAGAHPDASSRPRGRGSPRDGRHVRCPIGEFPNGTRRRRPRTAPYGNRAPETDKLTLRHFSTAGSRHRARPFEAAAVEGPAAPDAVPAQPHGRRRHRLGGGLARHRRRFARVVQAPRPRDERLAERGAGAAVAASIHRAFGQNRRRGREDPRQDHAAGHLDVVSRVQPGERVAQPAVRAQGAPEYVRDRGGRARRGGGRGDPGLRRAVVRRPDRGAGRRGHGPHVASQAPGAAVAGPAARGVVVVRRQASLLPPHEVRVRGPAPRGLRAVAGGGGTSR